ncbi:MAG: protein-glutamate O-methyltransferase CheR [Brevundimonas sp.]|nr:MAG: protein-glutamate O-methyltransferase CheR [Brevundimonas sp.]
MSPENAAFFRAFVLQRSGLVLTPEKDYLLRSRLEPLVRAEKLGDLCDLIGRIRMAPTGALAQKAVDAMATHESYFFRDATPFEQLRTKLLPSLIDRRRDAKRLRILSAACSSGQEPYSLAMLLIEQAGMAPGFRFDILATDMSDAILERARTGWYSDFEVSRGLSPERQARFMVHDGQGFRVADEVARMVRFRRHNLLEGVAGLGRFDLILCRNVLIYFDPARKAWVLDRLAEALEPDGALMLGSAETVVGLNSVFTPAMGQRGVFVPGAKVAKVA